MSSFSGTFRRVWGEVFGSHPAEEPDPAETDLQSTALTVTIGELARLYPQEGEAYVLHCSKHLTVEQIATIHGQWKQFMPNRKLIVLQPGMSLTVAVDQP